MARFSSTALATFLALGLAASSSACGSAETRAAYDPTQPAQIDTDGDGVPDSPDPNAPGATPAPQPGRVGCTGTAYTETLPTTASLAGLTFSQAKAGEYLLSALGQRYPLGKWIVDEGVKRPISGQPGTCLERFLSDKSSAAKVLAQAGTVVHECGHFLDIGKSASRSAAFVITQDLELSCKSGDTTTRGGKTFARSLLKSDAYYAKRKACGGQVRQGCDMYADIYLTGNATDAAFDSGDQGFNSLLEEATQYVNSIATGLAFADQLQNQKVSERDGILTFLWYVERYLKMAREEYPDAYATLSTDACWRQAILSVWDRGWFYVEASRGKDNLEIDAPAIEELVKDPELTVEIDKLRSLECK